MPFPRSKLEDDLCIDWESAPVVFLCLVVIVCLAVPSLGRGAADGVVTILADPVLLAISMVVVCLTVLELLWLLIMNAMRQVETGELQSEQIGWRCAAGCGLDEPSRQALAWGLVVAVSLAAMINSLAWAL